jgi:phospholipase/carboxylesterase
MADELLDAIEIETAPEPDAAVIWMHGLGDDGRGWSEVVPSLGLPKHLAIRFLFPHAPVMPVTINNGMRMRAWYDIRQANLSERADVDGVRRSQAQIGALLAREASRGIAANRTLLAGFSQGGAIALFAGLRFDARLAGVIALSAYLIAPERLAAEASAANRDVPVFMAHGTHDPVIAFAWAEHSRDVLKAGGWPLEWHAYPMEHAAGIDEIVAAGAFIARVLTDRRSVPRQTVGEIP